jgi:hypothetical protein
MRGDLAATVEDITGRTVLASMCANHVDPDLTCQILVLAPASTPAAPPERCGTTDG